MQGIALPYVFILNSVMPIEFKCRLCKHLWTPRRKHPKACPKCKRYDWRALEREEVKA